MKQLPLKADQTKLHNIQATEYVSTIRKDT